MAPDAQQQALQQVLAEAAARLDAGDAPAAFAVIGARGGVALRNPVGQNILGEIHLALNRPAEALGAFDAALRLAPAFAEAHANRGAALIDLGRPAEALDAERRALAARPDLALAHFNSGIALRALRRPEEARRLGDAARAFVATQQGATKRTVDLIAKINPALSSNVVSEQ